MEEAENAPLPLRIGALRRQKKMTQGALAEAADIPLRTLKAWETEKQPDSLPVVLRIADALGVTLDELAGVPERKDPPPAPPEVVVDGVLYAPAATNGAGGAYGPVGARSALSDDAASVGDARRPSPRPTPAPRQSKRRPASGGAQ